MMNRTVCVFSLILGVLCATPAFSAEPLGSIRGMVYDSDFDVPLPAAKVYIAETSETVVTTDEGNYVFGQVEPGTYTLVFSKEGYTRQVKADVVVSPGQLTEVNSSLSGEFEEMEEFIVQDVQIGTGTEAALLDLRMESPALLDSISADLMSQAGAGDAAAALNLVSGATVQDGKYATIRGLPDRYVSSQMNGVRLPTADPDKRAVQLDQFPATVIESVQVSKTFTPDQQGDASGGAVNIVLKGIPEERVFKISGQTGFNSNVKDAGSDFLSYDGGGVNTWGRIDDRPIPFDTAQASAFEAAGVSSSDPSTDYKWSIAFGDKIDFEDFTIGGFGSFFYERDSSFYDNGVDDKFWVFNARAQDAPFTLTPQHSGTLAGGEDAVFKTSLFDVTKATQSVQWGGMGVLGFESENHAVNLSYMFTRNAEDKAVYAENTRGKESLHTYWPQFFGPEFENYDPYDLTHPGNQNDSRFASPYRKFQTLEYTERTTETLQLSGRHTLFPDFDLRLGNLLIMGPPELDWTYAISSSTLYQPDKRYYSTTWRPTYLIENGQIVRDEDGQPIVTGIHTQDKPKDVFGLGNFYRIWKDIEEDSDQFSVNLKLPFEQWSGDEGYFKSGFFHDQVNREYRQESFNNLNAPGNLFYYGRRDYNPADDFVNDPGNIVQPVAIDVDYHGEQEISAWYYMMDLPLNSYFNIIGGARFEATDLSIANSPESQVVWYPLPPDPIPLAGSEADVDFQQKDMLPSLGFEFRPWDDVTLRGSYTETVARQTFKELTPIEQQEYIGSDIFIGNPNLAMSALKNYDLRLDWTPYKGGLFSVSYFYKDVTDAIEYVQKNSAYFTFTTPENYPEGHLSGFELEMRQQMGQLWESLEGVSLGANATFIRSEVTLPAAEAQLLREIGAPEPKRDMTNTPDHLYNLYATYDLPRTGTRLGLFYTVRGDTLTAGTGTEGANLIPSVYETKYGTLNFSLSQKLGEIWTLKFQAKNLLDPEIKQVYRSKYIGSDVTKTSYTKGMDFSISLSATF